MKKKRLVDGALGVPQDILLEGLKEAIRELMPDLSTLREDIVSSVSKALLNGMTKIERKDEE